MADLEVWDAKTDRWIAIAPRLVCAYCDGPLMVTMETKPGYGAYDVPGAIECAGENDCMASWHTDGTPWTDRAGNTEVAG